MDALITDIRELIVSARMTVVRSVEKVNSLFLTELERLFLPIKTDDWTQYDAREVFDIVKGQVDPREETYASLPHIAPDVMEIGTGMLFMDKIKTAKELELKSGKYLFLPIRYRKSHERRVRWTAWQ